MYKLSRFINTLDYSLDLIKMREIYKKVYRRKGFSFYNKGKEYSPEVINVTFKYSIKEFNKVKPNRYVKVGYRVTDEDMVDCVCIRNGELIAVQTESAVIEPISSEMMGTMFRFDGVMYHARDSDKTVLTAAQIRENLYINGFRCDGRRYVRYKRSSGSSRVGKCLFIDEALYPRMMKWSLMGVRVREGDDIDLASLEAYIALSLSSIIDTIEIRPENILIVDDYESVFEDNVMATRLKDDQLVTLPETTQISNSIWDGQSLMDKSLFGNYADKGMLLLRSRFFKSCCFNANIQDWFRDNGITEITQLNGYTRAAKIEDVKLITTPSSIKYLKFGSVKQFFDRMESVFGVVKYEKPTNFFEGRMVSVHYQLLNTLQMSRDEVQELLKPSLDYARLIRTDPAALRHKISYRYMNSVETSYSEAREKNDVVYRMLGVTDKFQYTKLYREFRNSCLKSYIKTLRKGHVLVHGNYSTLCGNPIEMLKQSIGRFDGERIIDKGTIHSLAFDDGVEILGSRSPHVTMGNVLVTKNKRRPLVDKYMNGTREIVYVNSIGENLLERLSGSDFDSDTLLLTDNEILVRAAKRNYDKFLVPTKLIKALKRPRRYTAQEKADLDIKTSVNKIGEIINLSQELNSLLWDRINNGSTPEEQTELYGDIAQLDVMSNLEIDAAKKENPSNNALELKKLREKYEITDEKGCKIRPLFFKYIDEYKGYRDGYYVYSKDENGEYTRVKVDTLKEAKRIKTEHENVVVEKGRMSYKQHDTVMDYLELCIDKRNKYRDAEKKLIPFSDTLVPQAKLKGTTNYNQVHKTVDILRETRAKIQYVWQATWLDIGQKMKFDYEYKNSAEERIRLIPYNLSTIRCLLGMVDKSRYSDISKTLFDMILATHSEAFTEVICQSKEKLHRYEEASDGDVNIMGYNYRNVWA